MKHLIFCTMLLVFSLVVGGCFHSTASNASPASVPMMMIAAGPMLFVEEIQAGGIWIADAKQLDGLSGQIAKGAGIRETLDGLHDIDFAEEGVLFIWMGRKPTGGYALEVAADRAEITNRTVRVPVRWVQPGKGAIVTQVITNPYVLIRLGKGDYDTIAVVDDKSSPRVTVQVNPDTN